VENRFHLPLQIHGRYRLGNPIVHSGDGYFILPLLPLRLGMFVWVCGPVPVRFGCAT
jgi:hypothetical protein